MMDLKEIIKWFIPCFHVLLVVLNKKDVRLTFICLFLLFNFRVGCAANVKSGLGKSVEIIDTKNLDSLNYVNKLKVNQSDSFGTESKSREFHQFPNASVGRTFGRPFKKMMGAMIPLIFQIGAASTWAVVAALVGVKTLAVSLIILKILLIAGAAKVGALFGAKVHGHSGGWEPHPPHKEIHLHIHNGPHDLVHDEHVPVYGAWSREDGTNAIAQSSNYANAQVIPTKHTAIDPYSVVGPQTIRTPFGNYVKVESNQSPLANTIKRRR